MDKFRHRLNVQTAGELDDATGHQERGLIFMEVANQTAINLDEVHVQAQQVGKIGVAGTEIVDGNTASIGFDLFNEHTDIVVIGNTIGFQDLEDNAITNA